MIFFASGGSVPWKGVVFERGVTTSGEITAVSGDNKFQENTPSQNNWQETLEKIGVSGGAIGSDNMTENLKQGIASHISNLQNNGSVVGRSPEEIAAEIIKNVPEENTAIVHAAKELSISEDSGAPALKTYGNSLASILLTYSTKLSRVGYEITIVGEAIDSRDASSLKKLPAIENLYKNMTNELLAMKIPRDVAKMHLNIINAYEIVFSATHDMELVISDPMRGLSGVSYYKVGSDAVKNNIVNISALFNLRGVAFEKGDAGSVFSKAIPQQ